MNFSGKIEIKRFAPWYNNGTGAFFVPLHQKRGYQDEIQKISN